MKYHLTLMLALATVSMVRAEDWPQWRGPHFNGSSDEKNLPSDWSQTENIAWTADLPGSAAATPIVWANHLFLSGVDTAKDVTQAMAFDRTSGKLLWSHDTSKGIPKGTSKQLCLGFACHRRKGRHLLLRQRRSCGIRF